MRTFLVSVAACLFAASAALAQFQDCNGNNVPDADDILSGTSKDCNGNGVPDECECVWDNGDPPSDIDDVDGLFSHIGGGAMSTTGFDAIRVADDVFLPPGFLHRVTAFRGLMINNSWPGARRARLEIFHDCNGEPEIVPFFTSTNFEILSESPRADGNYLVWYRFDLCDDQLWLDGGKTYWFSLIGETDRVTDDLSSWAVTPPDNDALLIRVPNQSFGMKIAHNTYEWDDWDPVCQGCPGCVNMVFKLDGYSCQILFDNGRPDKRVPLPPLLPGLKSGPYGAINWRSRDDFVLRNCQERKVCVIDAWVWANCHPGHGFIELYADNPCPPSPVAPEGEPYVGFLYQLPIDQVHDLGVSFYDGGDELRLYCIRVIEPVVQRGTEPPGPLCLDPGRTYWISAGATLSGSFSTKSLFAFSERCCPRGEIPCAFQMNRPQTRRQSAPSTAWLPSTVSNLRDLAFRIAVEPLEPGSGASTTSIAAEPDCPADLDFDGAYSVQDIFMFLSEWFTAACP
jgi:hypothetical protein